MIIGFRIHIRNISNFASHNVTQRSLFKGFRNLKLPQSFVMNVVVYSKT